MEYDVSVIVPVYNGEKLLPNTLGNLLNQSKDRLEIILVNDASTDNSLRVLNDAKAAFPDRVIIIDLNENRGPGFARNMGLQAARGEYIGFMDADDLIDISMYEKLYSLARENNADIVDSAYFRDSTQKALVHFSKENLGELDDKKRGTLISCGGYNCMKIFKKSMLDKYNITFRPAYILEDMDFLVRAIICAKKVNGTEDVLYRYGDTGGSLSKEENFSGYINAQREAALALDLIKREYSTKGAVIEAVNYIILSMYKNILVMLVKNRGRVSDNLRMTLLAKVKEAIGDLANINPRDNNYASDKLDEEELNLITLANVDEAQLLKLQ